MVDRFAADRATPPSLNEWLAMLLERFGPMAERMSKGLSASQTAVAARAAVQAGKGGAPLTAAEVRRAAGEVAYRAGKSQAAERDVVGGVLQVAGYEITLPAPQVATPPLGANPSPDKLPPSARPLRLTPVLDQFGRDLTAAAAAGKLGTVVGRETEIDALILTLCRATKRNPLLVGPPGSGKTAIVEALAKRLHEGPVPEMLRGVRLISLQPSNIVAGSSVYGELDKRMQSILAEASDPGILLFIDEVHAIMGAGGREGTGDISSMLKPALARGEIAVIAATTDDEFRRFIESDKALERRFQPIRVNELSPTQTLAVLQGLLADIATPRGVTVGDSVLRWLIDAAAQLLPNRHFPDKAVDLLDSLVAYSLSTGKQSPSIADAEEVVARVLGVKKASGNRLRELHDDLLDHDLLTAADVERLVERLSITTRGLDIRVSRPNAVVLLQGAAAARADEVAHLVARHLYGADERVVRLDFSRFVDEISVRALLGAPPSYVGYADRHALDPMAETPWSVLLGEHVDRAHPLVRRALLPALTHGVVSDARGRRIYFSDSVVFLTAAGGEEGSSRPIGFHAAGTTPAAPPGAAPTGVELFGDDWNDGIDFVFTSSGDGGGFALRPDSQVEEGLLSSIAARFRHEGVEFDWDPSVQQWLSNVFSKSRDMRDLERAVEEDMLPDLTKFVLNDDSSAPTRVRVAWRNGAVEVTPGSP